MHVFSPNLRWGYDQIELDEQSKQYTTYVTDTGLYRCKRLMFGVSAASEICQHVIQQSLQGCPGVRNISDDIIVFGKTQQEHDHNLHTVLARLQESGLTLNRDKCKFSVSEVAFFGYTIAENGIRPPEETVAAIRNAPKPSNTSEVRNSLGRMNYCSRFIPNFSTIAAPLRQLTHKGTPFTWTNLHQNAFESLQKTLTSNSVMAHFDPSAPTQLRVDTSPVGLGAILTQTHGNKTRPVAYASRHPSKGVIPRLSARLWLLSGDVNCSTSIYMGQPLTSIQIASLLKLFTVQHRNLQRESNGGAFVCNRINFVLSIHLELIILRTCFLVCHSPMQQPIFATQLKNMSTMSFRMQLLRQCLSEQ